MTQGSNVSISLNNASVEFPLLSAQSRSLRNRIVKTATAGQFSINDSGHHYVRGLDSVSLEIARGERVGLLGRNGAGKSTLLRVLGGIYEPTSGSATIIGKPTTLMDISLGINPEATGLQNIFLQAALMGVSKNTMKNHIDEILDFSELGDFIHLPVRTYSSGMQLRLALAVSTVSSPEILIMDEWLSVGDEAFKAKAEKKLRQLVDDANILVIATHSRELVESVCTRALLIDQGRVILDGTPTEVAAAYFTP